MILSKTFIQYKCKYLVSAEAKPVICNNLSWWFSGCSSCDQVVRITSWITKDPLS